MIDIKSKEDCCGCTACKNICPKNAIILKKDKEGFEYPEINEKLCIQCNLCEQVCPMLKRKEKSEIEIGYIVNHKNNEIRRQSTSGGAFTAIAEYTIKKNGIVFGACFDKEFNVVHSKTEKIDEIASLRKSKYVQSDLKETFKEVKEHLSKNQLVCFSGTPCQIEGLLGYLKGKRENLITVDFVCRAVPSPALYKKYLSFIQKVKLNNEKITEVLFRDKERYGYKYTTMTIKGTKTIYRNGVETDPYLRAFFTNISDRPSCYNCKFRTINRKSDFTIWDCFITEEFDKKMDDNLGTTRIIIHTNKGKEIFNCIKKDFIYKQVEVETLTKDVKELKMNIEENKVRQHFFKDMENLSTEELFKKYFPDTIKVKCERMMRKILVHFSIYKKIKKIAKKIIKR